MIGNWNRSQGVGRARPRTHWSTTPGSKERTSAPCGLIELWWQATELARELILRTVSRSRSTLLWNPRVFHARPHGSRRVIARTPLSCPLPLVLERSLFESAVSKAKNKILLSVYVGRLLDCILYSTNSADWMNYMTLWCFYFLDYTLNIW